MNSHGANRHPRAIIDLEALKNNYRYLKQQAGGNRLIAVVKADVAPGDSEALVAAVTVAREAALDGAILQMFTHGIISAALFMMVGLIYDNRTHVRDFRELGGGLWRTVPTYGTFLIIAAFASLGLPGLAGFVAEFLTFRGAFGVGLAGNTPLLVLTSLSVFGILFTAAFYLWKVIQMLMLGPQNERWTDIEDLNWQETAKCAVLTAFMVIIGLFPMTLMGTIHPASQSILANFTSTADVAEMDEDGVVTEESDPMRFFYEITEVTPTAEPEPTAEPTAEPDESH